MLLLIFIGFVLSVCANVLLLHIYMEAKFSIETKDTYIQFLREQLQAYVKDLGQLQEKVN